MPSLFVVKAAAGDDDGGSEDFCCCGAFFEADAFTQMLKIPGFSKNFFHLINYQLIGIDESIKCLSLFTGFV